MERERGDSSGLVMAAQGGCVALWHVCSCQGSKLSGHSH